MLFGFAGQAGATTLADQPVFATSDVPGNLALALSVEFPTAISVANLNDYADATTYLGYFDPGKCYTYTYDLVTAANSYFQPAGKSTGTNGHSCSSKWSGNFMNWATMQTIDPFRWALSGGFRSVDDGTSTILEKGWGASQGSLTNFPLRGTDQGSGHKLPTSLVSTVTPFSSWGKFNSSIWSRGNTMVFTSTGDATKTGVDLNGLAAALNGPSSTYKVYVRVKVCDTGTSAGGLEANCVKYGSIYKPEGLLQQYANKIQYSAFAYLNDNGSTRQGGVMRAPMGFIGPTYPTPLSTTVTNNSRAEWNSSTGIMGTNPDTVSSSANTGITQSGVMNYLNKFGQTSKTYMTNDNVSELYYAVIRYFQNLGNVPEWTNNMSATALDGFPAVVDWSNKDPITYSCQKNFILGIGDDHTHYDRNTGGGTLTNGRAKPALVSSDTRNKSADWTSQIETLDGLTSRGGAWQDQGSEYIAGLAYGNHVNDMRPDKDGVQTISTYWMDVMEYQYADDLNPYYLAAKYGGFSVPSGYTMGSAIAQSTWNTGGQTINMNGNTRLRPDNYFLAGNASQMVDGLNKAFANIANAIKAFTTSFSLSTAQVSSTGSASYASQYDSKGWTGVITGSKITFDTNGIPSSTTAWVTSSTMETQLTGTGWDSGRRIATWSGTAGVPFRSGTGGINSAQLTALKPTGYATSNTAADYLNYLRGDRTNETTSVVTGSTKAYRSRTLLLGDIVDAKVTPVATPSNSYSDLNNPGYAAFQTTWASRPTMVYAGANDGMLHAFNGALTGTGAGTEQFAYVPSAVISGPSGTPQTDGLAQLGNPNYVHRYSVDATPLAFDIDFGNAGGAFLTTPAGVNADWRTLLIGGLGKGGKSYYAIDVTNPASMTTEAVVASKVKWEFTDSTMGFSFGAPTVVKTRKYGWVVILTSGYNNSDGIGYLYIVNPKTGALLERIATPTSANGLAQASAYVQDFSDGTADAVYAGDLNGQLWRFDLTLAKGSSSNYPTATKIATLTDGTGTNAAQPITTAPLIEVHPLTRKRFVMFGTGTLLNSGDVTSAASQSFYALVDGTGGSGAFSTITTPITRADLTGVTDVTVGIALSGSSKGWYVDLGTSSNVGWRVVSSPTAYNGVVAFASLLTTGDPCSPTGQSRVYALNYNSGKSVLLNTTSGYTSFTNSVTDLRFITVDKKPQLIAGTTSGEIKKVDTDLTSGITLKLLNWRELPTVE